ncbi:Gamma-tubulin complex component 2-like protein [Drosera capensis]
MESTTQSVAPSLPAVPSPPPWYILTGHFHQEAKSSSSSPHWRFDSSNSRDENPVGCYDASVQELIVIDDLLSAMVGIEGRYIYIRRSQGKEEDISFHVDASMDSALQDSTMKMFPLCKSFLLIQQFVESRSQMKTGLVNHAFAAALRSFLVVMVAQLEHQFRQGRLSLEGLQFHCQMASLNNLAGVDVLNLLQSQAKAMGGDHVVRSLLENMAQSASSAYLGILESARLDDALCFLAETLTLDYDAKYWQQRYSLKDSIPSFLADVASTILTTGKYLNVMRECGHNVKVQVTENCKLRSFGSTHHHRLESVKAAYDFTSSELLNLMKEKYDLIGKLRSIKHYLLLDQSLLDLALRSTAAAADPCHEDLICCVEKLPLLKTLCMLKDLEISKNVCGSDIPEEPMSITGLETFSLSYKVQWPMSIVLSKKALTKYQLIFRFLFHCKHVSRQLCAAWQVHQVIEPNWHGMHNGLLSAKSIDEVIKCHDLFLVKCLRECLLLLPELFEVRSLVFFTFLKSGTPQKVERLKQICLQYAAAAQRLIPASVDITKAVVSSDEDSGLRNSLQSFEKEFNSELQSLGPILSSRSQAEPYLTHLAQWILGIDRTISAPDKLHRPDCIRQMPRAWYKLAADKLKSGEQVLHL